MSSLSIRPRGELHSFYHLLICVKVFCDKRKLFLNVIYCKVYMYILYPDKMQCALASLKLSRPFKRAIFPDNVDLIIAKNQRLKQYKNEQKKIR